MNKIKIERSIKLRDEEIRGRKFNILTGATDKEGWKASFGDQLKLVEKSANSPTHDDMKSHWKAALA